MISIVGGAVGASNSTTCNKPPGTQPGDFMLWFAFSSNVAVGVPSFPAGWTSLGSVGNNAASVQCILGWKRCDASDGGSFTYTAGSGASFDDSSIVSVRSPFGIAVDLSNSSAPAHGTSGTFNPLSASRTGDVELLCINTNGDQVVTFPSGFTTLASATDVANGGQSVATRQFPPLGSTGSRAYTVPSADDLAGFSILLRETVPFFAGATTPSYFFPSIQPVAPVASVPAAQQPQKFFYPIVPPPPAAGGIIRTISPVTVALRATLTRTISPVTAALLATLSRTVSAITVALLATLTRTISPVTAALLATLTRTLSSVTAALQSTLSRTISPVTAALQATLIRTISPVTAALQSTLTRTISPVTAVLQSTLTRTISPVTAALSGGAAVRTIAAVTAALQATVARTIASVTAALQATLIRTIAAVTVALQSTFTRTVSPVTVSLQGTLTRTISSVTAALSGGSGGQPVIGQVDLADAALNLVALVDAAVNLATTSDAAVNLLTLVDSPVGQ